MEHKRAASLVLGLLILICCTGFASAQTSPVQPQPLATLDVSQLSPDEPASLTLTTVAFSSEDSIAVEIFRTAVQGPQFVQYTVQWQSGSFNRIAEVAGMRWGGTSSADGRRKLLEISKRKVPGKQHLLEVLHTVTTLGMSGPEDVNREAVRVIDTSTRKLCFEWHRSFPMDWRRGRFATISPSGELVAITVDNKLSIYRLPLVCEDPTKEPK